VADGVRRIVRGQLDLAIEQLHEAEKGDPGEPVHEARKALKRTRAVARLARDALGDEVYRRENTEFRDTGRRLSDARDSQVMIETLDALQRRYGDEIPAGSMDRLRDQLAAEHREAIERLRQDAGTVEQSVQVLQAARIRVAGWTLERDGLESLAPGAQRVYRRGRRALGAADDEPGDESLHELRKRAKDLWHAAQVLRPVSPKQMKRLAREAHDLSDIIGEDHDLAVLRQEAERRADCFEDPATLVALQGLIDRRRTSLQAKGIKAARRIYRRKPGRFARKIERAAASAR
jgi:CHAD domain-containing protein